MQTTFLSRYKSTAHGLSHITRFKVVPTLTLNFYLHAEILNKKTWSTEMGEQHLKQLFRRHGPNCQCRPRIMSLRKKLRLNRRFFRCRAMKVWERFYCENKNAVRTVWRQKFLKKNFFYYFVPHFLIFSEGRKSWKLTGCRVAFMQGKYPSWLLSRMFIVSELISDERASFIKK